MLIVWDEPKRLTNLHKHGFDFASLSEDIVQAHLGRKKAIGRFQGQIIAVIFLPLGVEAFSIISMRSASQDERRTHA